MVEAQPFSLTLGREEALEEPDHHVVEACSDRMGVGHAEEDVPEEHNCSIEPGIESFVGDPGKQSFVEVEAEPALKAERAVADVAAEASAPHRLEVPWHKCHSQTHSKGRQGEKQELSEPKHHVGG